VDVVFLSPQYPPEMPHFTRGLAEVGVRVLGIADTPYGSLPADVRRYLSDYLQVPSIMDEDDVLQRATEWLRNRRTPIDKVLANWEPVMMLAARMSEAWGLPGMSSDAVLGFRDKRVMKERVEAAGLRSPRSERVTSAAEVYAAAERIGYPLVIKPIAGAGSADTYKVDDLGQLAAIIRKLERVPEAIVEEYIEGEELTYDTICIGGEPVYENVVQYFPKPLEGRSQEWISPAQLSVRDLSQPSIQKGITLGRGVMKALGMGDGYTHMEWFLTPKGEAVFGEIACRAGGAKLVDMMNYTSDVDLYREWARVVCHGTFEGQSERKYNVGVVFKRAKGRGVITRIDGLHEFRRLHGDHLLEETLSRPGTARRDWKQTLLSDGYLTFRHPDWSTAQRIAWDAATRITMYAQ